MARHEQPMGVKDGEHVQEHLAFAEAPGFVQHLGIREQVGVGEHRALRLAGGAGGVEERGEVAGLALDGVETIGHRLARLDEGAVVVLAEGERFAGTVPLAQHRESFCRFGSRHHQSWLGIPEKVVQLPFRIRKVERQIDGAHAQAREVEDERPWRLLDLHRDAIAGRNAPLAHEARVARRFRLDIGVRPHRAGRGFQAGGRAVGGEMSREQRVEIRVLHRSFLHRKQKNTVFEPQRFLPEGCTRIACDFIRVNPP